MTKLEGIELEAEIRHAHDLTREGNCAEAHAKLRDIRKTLGDAGIESAFVCWLAAVAADGLGLLSEAADLIERACAADRVCPQFQNSRRIIERRMVTASLFESGTGTTMN